MISRSHCDVYASRNALSQFLFFLSITVFISLISFQLSTNSYVPDSHLSIGWEGKTKQATSKKTLEHTPSFSVVEEQYSTPFKKAFHFSVMHRTLKCSLNTRPLLVKLSKRVKIISSRSRFCSSNCICCWLLPIISVMPFWSSYLYRNHKQRGTMTGNLSIFLLSKPRPGNCTDLLC
jgi:hypothetical protein